MENQTTVEKKVSKQTIIISVLFSVLFLLTCSLLIWVIENGKKELAEANSKLLQEQNVSNTCSYKKDSLTNEVNQISNYKTLVKSMAHRDEATALLKYKIGDFVYLKRDSDKVVISDIVIGGARFEYYIRYKVLHKDKIEEEIKPELIY